MTRLTKAVIATIGAGLALTLAGHAAADVAQGPLPPPADRELGRAVLKELIETNTTHAKGSSGAARAIRERLLAAGYAAADLTFIAPAGRPDKGNLVVRVHGSTRARPVLFLGHLDVVEALPADWTVDPFRFTEKDGFFYGRGTIDMKDGDAALVAGLVRLRREHVVPKRDLIVAFTEDEEAGSDSNGPAFLLREHRELIDAGVVVNLDGGGGTLVGDQRGYYEIGTSEKSYLTYTIETTGPGGHGSLPGPDNPIYRIAAALGRLEAYRFPVLLTDTTRATFRAYADLQGGPQAADLRAVAGTDPAAAAAAAARLSETIYLNAELRTTCVATLISGGHAENALPQRGRATIQCRMMPNDTEAPVAAQLRRVIADPSITLTLDATPIVSPESPPTPEVMALAAGVIHSMWPGVPVVPTMATGFSDDRQTRNAGMPSYDLSGIFVLKDENRAHGRDERVGVRAFDESVEYTYRLMKAFGDSSVYAR